MSVMLDKGIFCINIVFIVSSNMQNQTNFSNICI